MRKAQPQPLPSRPGEEASEPESPFYSSAEWVEIVALSGRATRGEIEAVFDEERNKFTIDATGVSEFLLDVCRVKVNWNRPVILKIDGRNSELRKRDYCRLRMRMIGKGAWEVVE